MKLAVTSEVRILPKIEAGICGINVSTDFLHKIQAKPDSNNENLYNCFISS